MHTDLEMTTITFRRGLHNHYPDPKIEQRARKGHFAKMPRKPRRKKPKSGDEAEKSILMEALVEALPQSKSSSLTNDENRVSSLMAEESSEELESVSVNAAPSGGLQETSNYLSVADDILAILTEATSEIKDSTVSPDLSQFLASADAALLHDSTNLAALAAGTSDGDLSAQYMSLINKKMINNVLSKFL